MVGVSFHGHLESGHLKLGASALFCYLLPSKYLYEPSSSPTSKANLQPTVLCKLDSQHNILQNNQVLISIHYTICVSPTFSSLFSAFPWALLLTQWKTSRRQKMGLSRNAPAAEMMVLSSLNVMPTSSTTQAARLLSKFNDSLHLVALTYGHSV